MSSPQNFSGASVRRSKSRKSLPHFSLSQNLDQENRTTDLGSISKQKRDLATEKKSKKSRSKSVGPGGLDSLNASSASIQLQVC